MSAGHACKIMHLISSFHQSGLSKRHSTKIAGYRPKKLIREMQITPKLGTKIVSGYLFRPKVDPTVDRSIDPWADRFNNASNSA